MDNQAVAEAYLSQQRSTLWGRSYDLSQDASFNDAWDWLCEVLDEIESIRKEPGWS